MSDGTLTDDVSLVVIVLDCNSAYWQDGNSNDLKITMSELSEFLFGVKFFINTLKALNPSNQIAAIGVGKNSCRFLFDSTSKHKLKSKDSKSSSSMASIDQFLRGTVKFVEEQFQPQNANQTKASLIAGGLSLALTFISKQQKLQLSCPKPRIFCLQNSPDSSQQYVAIMNAIFSAQRSSIPIDACVLGSQDSPFLQQASHLTGGLYFKSSTTEGILQYLNMLFSADLHSRQFLQLPKQSGVDFRASCFCHKEAIDLGWVCPICLSIFCKSNKVCTTCNENFGEQRNNPPS